MKAGAFLSKPSPFFGGGHSPRGGLCGHRGDGVGGWVDD